MINEYGHSQLEVPMRPQFDIQAVDNAFIYKDAARHIALNLGQVASFMTKPLFSQTGNGCHFNHSVWVQPQSGSPIINAFYDENNKEKISEVINLSKNFINV